MLDQDSWALFCRARRTGRTDCRLLGNDNLHVSLKVQAISDSSPLQYNIFLLRTYVWLRRNGNHPSHTLLVVKSCCCRCPMVSHPTGFPITSFLLPERRYYGVLMWTNTSIKSPHWTVYNMVNTSKVSLQLDCPSVRHWDYVITFADEVQFQFRDQFWIPQGKLHEASYLDFFCKTSKHVRLTSRSVGGVFKIFWQSIGSLNSIFFYLVGTVARALRVYN